MDTFISPYARFYLNKLFSIKNSHAKETFLKIFQSEFDKQTVDMNLLEIFALIHPEMKRKVCTAEFIGSQFENFRFDTKHTLKQGAQLNNRQPL